jgi:hypothetical protein
MKVPAIIWSYMWIYTGNSTKMVSEDGVNFYPANARSPGQVACEAWTASHLKHHQCGIVTWDELQGKDREDWENTAKALFAEFRYDT